MKMPVFNYSAIKNAQSDDTLDVFIDGDIVDASTQEFYKNYFGDDTSTSFKSLRDTLTSTTAKRVNIHINSGGGMMTDAFAMHDFIKENIANGKNWHTYGKGIVASAATYPLLAGLPDNMHISENCFHMIHNASGGVYGSVDEVESYATTMRKFNNTARDLYASSFNKPKETISAWMSAETWWTGSDMVTMGLIKPSNCGPADNAITNAIPKEKWLFQNSAILNTINNSITVPKNKGMKKNKIANAIAAAFTALGLTNDVKLSTVKVDELKNALTSSFEAIEDDEDVTTVINSAFTGDAFNTAVANAVKKVLETVPTNITDLITNSTKDLVKKTELDEVKNDLADKLGTPRVRKTGTENKNKKVTREEAELDELEEIMNENPEGIFWGSNSERASK